MSNPTEKYRVHFLGLPVEIHLEILRQLIGFQGDRTLVAHTWVLKVLRLVCKTLANLAAVYLFHDKYIRADAYTRNLLDADRFVLLSRSLGHHVRTLSFDLGAPREVFKRRHFASYIARVLPNLPNIRYLIVVCHVWDTVDTVIDSAIINAIAKLQHLEWVTFRGKGFGLIDNIHSSPSPTFFDTTFSEILSSHAEQLTSLSLDLCPFRCAPGTFRLLRKTARNLQVVILSASLPASLWPVFSQPVIWACANRLITLNITDIHVIYVPTLVKHIASGIFGNLKRLLIDQELAVRDRPITIPDIEWNIRPLDVLKLWQIPRLELEVLACLHSKDVHVEGVPRHTMIELVQGGRFKEGGSRRWQY